MFWSRRPRRPRPCSVYAAYNAAGEVIYVGISVDPERRWCQHDRDKPWAGEVELWQELERFPTVEEARAREAALIRSLRTRWNLDGSPVAAEVAARYVREFGAVPASVARRPWPSRLLVGILAALWTLVRVLCSAGWDLLGVVWRVGGRLFREVFCRRARWRSALWVAAALTLWWWTRGTRA